MNDRTERRPPWVPWAFVSLALLLVAVVAYGIGAHHQLAAAGGTTSTSHWEDGLPHFWGFVLFLWFFGAFRWFWWGWGPRYRPGRYHRYYRDDYDDWEEWHRREHERMDRAPGRQDPR